MTRKTQTIRIGNAHAFWGDRADAAAEMLAREPELDYITLDYLAEVSMSILAMQRERDPAAGFARDFLDVIRSLAPYWSAGGKCRLVTNAGGLNPRGCAEACRALLAEAGCIDRRISVVSGDDVLSLVRFAAETRANEFRNLDTGGMIGDVHDQLVTANAYLGAGPIVEALAGGADIVITGRVADPSLAVGPCIHHFGWSETDFDRLAGATVAGHLIECGTQVTGGISTDWLDVPDVANIGFPIVEINDDGSCVVTKPQGTGGCVDAGTVKEQLVYEIGDPGNYLSPDVSVSFLSLTVEDLGNNRVRVSGASGRRRPETYKVSATYRDGYRAAGMLTVIGSDAVAKARRCGVAVLDRVRGAGFSLRNAVVECLGSGFIKQLIDHGYDGCEEAIETVLRVAVEAESREAVERFSRELMPFITAGPQGTTGYAEGRPRVHPVFRYWPCLIARDALVPHVEMLERAKLAGRKPAQRAAAPRSPQQQIVQPAPSARRVKNADLPARLGDVARARSGDKGTGANIGVIARSDESWGFLQAELTAERVAEFFARFGVDAVERFEMPNLQALNFVLRGVLKNGLRIDAQGKALGQILLEMPLPKSERRISKGG
jgi:hypothetical protein